MSRRWVELISIRAMTAGGGRRNEEVACIGMPKTSRDFKRVKSCTGTQKVGRLRFFRSAESQIKTWAVPFTSLIFSKVHIRRDTYYSQKVNDEEHASRSTSQSALSAAVLLIQAITWPSCSLQASCRQQRKPSQAAKML